MNDRHDGFAPVAQTIDPDETKARPHVLVVDDSKDVRDVIVWLLRHCGYRAIAAENGLAAQLLLLAEQPLLIVSDLNMPLCDGWELLAFCHQHHPEIPVLIVSGERLGAHPEIERWAAGFVPKPFIFEQFRSEVDRLISRAA